MCAFSAHNPQESPLSKKWEESSSHPGMSLGFKGEGGSLIRFLKAVQTQVTAENKVPGLCHIDDDGR